MRIDVNLPSFCRRAAIFFFLTARLAAIGWVNCDSIASSQLKQETWEWVFNELPCLKTFRLSCLLLSCHTTYTNCQPVYRKKEKKTIASLIQSWLLCSVSGSANVKCKNSINYTYISNSMLIIVDVRSHIAEFIWGAPYFLHHYILYIYI